MQFFKIMILIEILSLKQQCQYLFERNLKWHFFSYWYVRQWKQILKSTRNFENLYKSNFSSNFLTIIYLKLNFLSSRLIWNSLTRVFLKICRWFWNCRRSIRYSNWIKMTKSSFFNSFMSFVNRRKVFFENSFSLSKFCFWLNDKKRFIVRLRRRKAIVTTTNKFVLNDTTMNIVILNFRDRFAIFFSILLSNISILTTTIKFEIVEIRTTFFENLYKFDFSSNFLTVIYLKSKFLSSRLFKNSLTRIFLKICC